MSEKIILRRANAADLATIKNFSQSLIEFDSDFDNSMDINWSMSQDGDEFFTSRINGPDGVVFLAINDAKIIGCLVGGIAIPHSYRKIKRLAEVEEIFVLPKYRSAKIGLQLMQVFELWCRENKIERIKVEVSAANALGIKFYNKNGFVPYNMILEKELN